MSTVDEITYAIAALPPEGRDQIRAWLADRDAEAWDRQIERDVKEGRLEASAERALAEHRAGRTTRL